MKKLTLTLLFTVSILAVMFTLVACANTGVCSGHVWDELEVLEQADCTHSGYIFGCCTKCGVRKWVTVDPYGHKDANNDGVCDVCMEGDCSHSYVDTVISPTCEVGGYTIHTCSLCGKVVQDSETIPTGHAWGSWTNTEDGYCEIVCANDETHTQTHVCDPEINDLDLDNNCDVCGFYICDVIGHIDTDEFHDYRCDRVVDTNGTKCAHSTCIEHYTGPAGPGSHIMGTTTTGHRCINCDYIFPSNEIDFDHYLTEHPTCTSYGYYGYIAYLDNGDVYADINGFIAPLGHEDFDNNGMCDQCDGCMDECVHSCYYCEDEDEGYNCPEHRCLKELCQSDEDHEWHYESVSLIDEHWHIKYCSICNIEIMIKPELEYFDIPATCIQGSYTVYGCVDCGYIILGSEVYTGHPHYPVDENKDCTCDLCGESVNISHEYAYSCDGDGGCYYDQYGHHENCPNNFKEDFCKYCGSSKYDGIDFNCQHENTTYYALASDGYHCLRCEECDLEWNYEEHVYGEIKHGQNTCRSFWDTTRTCLICGYTDGTDYKDEAPHVDTDENYRCDICGESMCFYPDNYGDYVFHCIDVNNDYFCDNCGDSVCELIYGHHDTVLKYDNNCHWDECVNCGARDWEEYHDMSVWAEMNQEVPGCEIYIDGCDYCKYATFSWNALSDCSCDEIFKDEDGNHKCDRCDAIVVHRPSDGVLIEVVAPTCTKMGYSVFECTLCGVIFNDDLVLYTMEHQYEFDYSENDGCITYNHYVCVQCGCDMTETIDGHNYEITYHEPASCDSYEYTEYTCTICGANDWEYNWDATLPEHNYDEGVIECTCNQIYIVYTCTDCGTRHEDHIGANPTGHNFQIVETKPAGCTTYGYSRYECQNENCTVWHIIYDYSVKPTGHKFVETIVEPTCAQGYTYSYCESCDYVSERYDFTPAVTEHNYVECNRQESTCVDYGYIDYECTVCGDHYSEDLSEFAPHTDTDSDCICDYCNADVHTHSSSCTCIVTDPTFCNEYQTITHICDVCGEYVEYNYDIVGETHTGEEHYTNNWEDGTHSLCCSGCDEVFSTEDHCDNDFDQYCDVCNLYISDECPHHDLYCEQWGSDVTHEMYCSDCGGYCYDEDHYDYDDDGECDGCGQSF